MYSSKDSSSFSNPNEAISTNIHIDWTLESDNKIIKGFVRHSITINENFIKYVHFDSKTKIDKILLDLGNHFFEDADYTIHPPHPVFGNKLSIQVPQSHNKVGSTFDVVFHYTIDETASAVQWLDTNATNVGLNSYVFTQSQAIHARALLRCIDTPAVKTPYTAVVRGPEWCTVLMSELAVKASVSPLIKISTNKTDSNSFNRFIDLSGVFRWSQPIDVSAYLIDLVGGRVAVEIFDKFSERFHHIARKKISIDLSNFLKQVDENVYNKANSKSIKQILEQNAVDLISPHVEKAKFYYEELKNSALAPWFAAKTVESEVNLAYHEAYRAADAEAGPLFYQAIAKREEVVTSWGNVLKALTEGLAAVPENCDDLKTWWNCEIENIKDVQNRNSALLSYSIMAQKQAKGIIMTTTIEEAETSPNEILEKSLNKELRNVPEHRDDLKTWWKLQMKNLENNKINKIFESESEQFLNKEEKESLYDLQNSAHRKAHKAIDVYRVALERDIWSDEVFANVDETYQAWINVHKHCKDKQDVSLVKICCWDGPLEVATREVENWLRAKKQFDDDATPPEIYSTEEELREFSFAEVYSRIKVIDPNPQLETRKEITILRTMFKHPYIRMEKLFEKKNNEIKCTTCMVANQLALTEKGLGELTRFFEDKKSDALVDFISKSEDGSSGLFQFNLNKLYKTGEHTSDKVDFPPKTIVDLLNGYELIYSPNYLLF